MKYVCMECGEVFDETGAEFDIEYDSGEGSRGGIVYSTMVCPCCRSEDIEEAKELHVQRIGQVISQWDLTSSNLVFIGGTSELLRKYIERQYGKRAFIPEESNLINCRGFLRAMLVFHGYKAEV